MDKPQITVRTGNIQTVAKLFMDLRRPDVVLQRSVPVILAPVNISNVVQASGNTMQIADLLSYLQ